MNYFTSDDVLVYSNYMKKLLEIGLPHYKPKEWKLFIDNTKSDITKIFGDIR